MLPSFAHRARVNAERAGCVMLAEFYERLPSSATGRPARISPGHRDREIAKQYTDDIAAPFRKETSAPVPDLTLAGLVNTHQREVARYKQAGREAAAWPEAPPSVRATLGADHCGEERRPAHIVPLAEPALERLRAHRRRTLQESEMSGSSHRRRTGVSRSHGI